MGVGAAFVFGLFMDVHRAGLLGQHALVYTALSYLAIMVHRRILWFPVSSQALQVLPLLMAVHVLELIVRLISGDSFPNWSFCWRPFAGAAVAGGELVVADAAAPCARSGRKSAFMNLRVRLNLSERCLPCGMRA